MTLLDPEDEGGANSQEIEEARRRLEAAGLWRAGLVLETFDWLVSLAPAGALEGVQAFRLIDAEAAPPRGEGWRNWEPVLIDADGILVGPSPEMLKRILLASGYFERPQEFGEQLLLQFHRFSMDFYDGYQVRERSFVTEGESLVIEGQAGRAQSEGTFRTVATPTGVEFTATVGDIYF